MEREMHSSQQTQENTFESVEDSLNALLADLQTNLNKVSPHPASPLHHTTPPLQNSTPPANSRVVEFTRTVQVDQHKDRNGDSQHIYQNEDHREHSDQNHYQNGFHVREMRPVMPIRTGDRAPVTFSPQDYQNSNSAKDKMYRHETREEVRTETRSSGPNPTQPRSGISNNLSELDSLLHDLNTTKQNSIIKESTVINGTRPSVDSLLDELNSVGGQRESTEKRTIIQETRTTHPPPPPAPSSYTHKVSHVSASNATKELDDLMESLSDFKINADTAYAKPLPKRRSPSPPKPLPKPAPPNQLDSMLGSLTSHMTEQGINTSQKGCCCACDKPIVGQVITALGKTWHPEHFVCAHCKEELGTKNFFERDGKPYCETDYHNLFSPKCAYCSGPILDKCVTAMNKTWHPEHFFCAQCGNTFGEEGFHEKNGKPYCKDDYFNMFAPKCGGCNNPIMENYISALNSQWHPECFVCRDCNQPFNGGSFFDHEGLPYCETHYHAKRGSLCAACNKPITGRCITAMFRKYHPEHFLCAFCLQQLNKGTFKEQNNKPYCHACFDKLYG